mgnify:CR=1 FL=1|jgi:hypothetical protein
MLHQFAHFVPEEDAVDAVIAAWRRFAGARAFPARTDLDPLALGSLLPHVMILDVVETGAGIDFRYRLLGEALKRGYGANITGRLHGEFVKSPAGAFKPVRSAYLRAFNDHVVVRFEAMFRGPEDTPKRLRAAVMPLSDDGINVTGLLGVGVFVDVEINENDQPESPRSPEASGAK